MDAWVHFYIQYFIIIIGVFTTPLKKNKKMEERRRTLYMAQAFTCILTMTITQPFQQQIK